MLRTMLLSKIHRARVTQRDLNYIGSITIDKNLLDASGMFPGEKVEIYNISNGNRFATYIFEGEPGSGIIGIEEEITKHKPEVIVVENDTNTKFYKL
jgi:aspartate 1-decarboxylase